MISVSGLSMQFGNQVLFEDVSIQINPGIHYGLVGANGSGKSTLLKILAGKVSSETGSVSIPNEITIGVLEQDHFAYEDMTLREVVLMGKKALYDALKEKDILLAMPDMDEAAGQRLGELEMVIADQDGYMADVQIETLLNGLGLDNHDVPLKSLSGGYKLRVLLAKCLFSDPDILLLDEPTNHLDLGSIHWLEGYLAEYRGASVIISHDRHFINRVCGHILDVDYETVRDYKGNYDAFVAAKELERTQKETEIARQEKKKDEMQAFVDRFKAKASKARQASSKAKQIEKMEEIVIKRSSRVAPFIRFKQLRPSGKDVIRGEKISKAYGEKQVLKNVDLNIKRGERLAIIGPNGIGKSTLLKILAQDLQATSGQIEFGHEVREGYFPQDHKEVIPAGTTPYEWLYSFDPGAEIGKIRGFLGQMLLSGDAVHKKTEHLSGGEAARLIIARLMLLEPNLLLIDEPTNHMDLESIMSLSKALNLYEGTVIFVSHDRTFIEEVATGILELKRDGYEYFPGSYGEYIQRKGEDYLDKALAMKVRDQERVETKPKEAKSEKVSGKQAFQDQKEAKKLQKQLQKLEAQEAELKAEIKNLEDRLAQGDLFKPGKQVELKQVQTSKAEQESRLKGVMADWEKIQNRLEALNG